MSSLTPTESRLPLNRIDDVLIHHSRRATWVLAGLVFLALNVTMRFSLHQPPVWDGAMSVYPAAIELTRTDFDFARLFSLPTYLEGGPNTHSTSPWTVIVACLIAATGSLANALPILHTISFALAALTVAAAYRLIAHSAPGVIAVLGAMGVLLFPPMMVQTADIYLDLPVACLGTWSLVMLLERRIVAASLLTTLAVWVKPLAVIFAAVGVTFIYLHDRSARRLRHALAFFGPPSTIAVVIAFLEDTSSKPQLAERYMISLGGSARLLGAMPDLIVLGLVSLFCIFSMAKRAVRHDTLTITGLMLLSSAAFLLLNPVVSYGVPLLPRYYVVIVPAVVAGALSFIWSKSRAIAISGVTALILAFALNLNGSFYPYEDHATFALAERSFAYRDLLSLQIEDVSRLTLLSQEMPVYYDYFAFYRFEYPELGYSDGPLSSGISVFHIPEIAQISLQDMPNRFAFIFEYPVLGGEELLRIWQEARESDARLTETALSRGRYTVYIVEVNQDESVNPSGQE